MGRNLIAALVVFLTLFIGVTVAYAYDETNSGRGCNDCHGLEAGETSPTVSPTRKGPHGGYSTGTQKCQTCHLVHNASSGGLLLLPGATIKATCESCHDGTGGKGVYGVIQARGEVVASAHSIEATSLVPGGDPSGGFTNTTFSAIDGTLTCSDCHSPHDSNTVASFTGDRVRESTPTAFPGDAPALATNRLLRQRPRSSDVTVTVYGSGWCGSCHKGRLFGSAGLINHPVETETAGFAYDTVQVLTAAGASTTTTGTLGASNLGYVMPDPRTTGQAGHYPICQQCHEDPRSVGNETTGTVTSGEMFDITAADGANSSDNPRTQVFPHESTTASLLLEENDSLCLNCHVPPD